MGHYISHPLKALDTFTLYMHMKVKGVVCELCFSHDHESYDCHCYFAELRCNWIQNRIHAKDSNTELHSHCH